MAKEVIIVGGIYHPDGQEINLDELTDSFIEFIESKGLAFGGSLEDPDLFEEESKDFIIE